MGNEIRIGHGEDERIRNDRCCTNLPMTVIPMVIALSTRGPADSEIWLLRQPDLTYRKQCEAARIRLMQLTARDDGPE
jgi:hypothetical protein